MALLGALAAAGDGRRGCVLRVAANAITFYCGGSGGSDTGGGLDASGGLDAGVDDDNDGPADYYVRTVASQLDVAANNHGRAGRMVDYFRPVRSVSIDAVGSGDSGYYYDFDKNNTAAAILANATAGIEPFLNGSYNHTVGVENVENLTNYIFVITIGIILGAMILTTICGKYNANYCYLFEAQTKRILPLSIQLIIKLGTYSCFPFGLCLIL